MGVSYGHYKQGGSTANARNTTLDYVNAGARITKGLGMSFGFVPYSTIGYNFTTSARTGSTYTSSQTITSETTYYGNGGLHQMYFGLGWRPFADLSIGANVSYIWGDYNHSLAQTFYEGSSSSSNYSTLNSEWSSLIHTYKVDLGVQYPIRLSRADWLCLGGTVGLGHTIGTEVEMLRYTSLGDSIETSTSNAFDLPYTISAGAAWNHQGRITIAADYTLEKWDGCRVPVSKTTSSGNEITVSQSEYTDRHKASLGVEYIRDPLSRRYSDRIRYRLGASYATPYVRVNGAEGPSEMKLTAGVAVPLTNASKSLVNVNLEWMRRAANDASLIKENYIMLHLGVTFNERWFMKWKFN